MKPIFKTIIIIFAYMIICFLGCVIFAAFQENPYAGTVLPHNSFFYKILQGILIFVDFLPSICGTGALIGLSWGFSQKSANMKRFSKIQLENLKSVLIVSLISTVLCFVFSEFVRPICNSKKTKIENEAQNYIDFFYYANQYKSQKKYDLAEFYVENALKIYPNSEKALALSKEIEYLSVDTVSEEYDSLEEMAKYVAHIDSSPKTPDEEILYLLETSLSHYENGDYFNSHYYATQAQYLSAEGSLNHQATKNIAADSWNKISATENKYDKDLAELFAEKKRGYVALLEEDYIKAYYIFENLIDQGFNDKDIFFYKDISEQGLLNITFFTDETDALRRFESFRDVYFTITSDDGKKDVIYIRGITILEDAGQFVQYFRNFSMYSYDKQGKFLKSVFTPYAKMIALPVKSLGNSLSNNEEINKNGYVPYVLLKSVDRFSSNTQVSPKYNFAEDYPFKSEENYLILEMPYEDFNLIRQASIGHKEMPIPSLFQFAKKAANYGYSSAIFSYSLTSRICYPLFLMICFIYVGLFAWNYRLMPGRRISFRWYLTFPLFNILVFLVYHVLDYFGNIFFFTLFGSIGTVANFAAPIILVLALFISGLAFLSSHGE